MFFEGLRCSLAVSGSPSTSSAGSSTGFNFGGSSTSSQPFNFGFDTNQPQQQQVSASGPGQQIVLSVTEDPYLTMPQPVRTASTLISKTSTTSGAAATPSVSHSLYLARSASKVITKPSRRPTTAALSILPVMSASTTTSVRGGVRSFSAMPQTTLRAPSRDQSMMIRPMRLDDSIIGSQSPSKAEFTHISALLNQSVNQSMNQSVDSVHESPMRSSAAHQPSSGLDLSFSSRIASPISKRPDVLDSPSLLSPGPREPVSIAPVLDDYLISVNGSDFTSRPSANWSQQHYVRLLHPTFGMVEFLQPINCSGVVFSLVVRLSSRTFEPLPIDPVQPVGDLDSIDLSLLVNTRDEPRLSWIYERQFAGVKFRVSLFSVFPPSLRSIVSDAKPLPESALLVGDSLDYLPSLSADQLRTYRNELEQYESKLAACTIENGGVDFKYERRQGRWSFLCQFS